MTGREQKKRLPACKKKPGISARPSAAMAMRPSRRSRLKSSCGSLVTHYLVVQLREPLTYGIARFSLGTGIEITDVTLVAAHSLTNGGLRPILFKEVGYQ